MCKYGNKCNNKKECNFTHSDIELSKLKRDLYQWNELRKKHWYLSIKNYIGKRYGNEIDKYDIILTDK